MILRLITIINFSAVYSLKNFHRIRLPVHFTKNMMCLNKIMLSHKSYIIAEYFLDFLSQMSHSGDLLYLVFIRRRESSVVCLWILRENYKDNCYYFWVKYLYTKENLNSEMHFFNTPWPHRWGQICKQGKFSKIIFSNPYNNDDNNVRKKLNA